MLELLAESGFVGEEGFEDFVALVQPVFQLLELLLGLGRDGGGFGQQARIEGQAVGRLGAAGISAGEPEAEVVELTDSSEGIKLADGLVAVDGEVAEVLNQAGFGEDGGADGGAKGRLVNQGAEMLLVGELQSGVAFIEPENSEFERAAGGL